MSTRPSKILLSLLRICSPKNRLDDLEGDLTELFEERSLTHGKASASFHFLLDALTLIPLKLLAKNTSQSNNTTVMLKNYFKIAVRNLLKDKTYALINISGLAVGMACAFVILVFVKLELSFDTFHAKADQIHRVQHVYSVIGAPIGPAMVEEFPEVVGCTRIYTWAKEVKTIVSTDQVFYEAFFLADHNFFETFSFEFIAGNPTKALTSPESVVITESTAKKYFGDANPVGQVIMAESLNHLPQIPLKVTGVIKDVPYNSHLQFTHVASLKIIENNPNVKIMDSWINDWIATYLILGKDADPTRVESEYWDFYERHAGVQYPDPFRLMPMKDVRHHSNYLRADFIEQGNINHIHIFSIVAILVLLIACINYMNLATAKSTQRAKEVGLRKVMGAFRKQLLIQFLVESLAISSLALIMGSVIVWACLPFLENLSDISISEGLKDIGQLVGIIVAVTLLTGIVAGSYPAFYLSSFGASDILKESKNPGKRSGLIRKGLVVLQLSISVALIVSTLVVVDQMNYVSQKDLGFKPDQTLILNYGFRPSIDEEWDFLKTQVGQIPGVVSVASTRSIPGDNASNWRYHFEGDPEEGDGFPGYYVGPNTVGLLGMEVIKGRSFSEEIETDKNAFILTEMAWKEAIALYGEDWQDPIGKTIQYSTTNSGDWQIEKTGEVIGVVKDFHSRSLQMPKEKLVLQQASASRYMLVKFQSEDTHSVVTDLEALWSSLGSSKPFNYKFLDQQYASYYESETRFSQLLYIFCGLAILIACLGLFGLASFTAQRRIKEIGIRKVMGASVFEIFTMITSDFIQLIGIALVIAFPLAWYFSSDWLDNFAYRIDISWVSFISAAIFTILLSLITVSWRSLKASTSNPVDSLRHE